MGHKIITEKDFWQCSGGMMATPFQGQQKIAKKSTGEKYILKTDQSTASYVDFGCKKIMWLYAVIATIAAVAACLIVATGGAALVLIAAAAGAAGAAWGAAVGTLICGQLAAPARKWLTYKTNFKILGIETITGGDMMQCNAFTFLGMSPEYIKFNPQIKSWSQAIKMGAASFIANVLQGALTGMLIGAAAVALPALIKGGMAVFAEGAATNIFMGSWNVARFLGGNVLRNYIASWLTPMGLGLRTVMVAQSELEGYGERGYVTIEDYKNGLFGMELGTVKSIQNIANGSLNPLDYIGIAMWFTPAGNIFKGRENGKANSEGETAKNERETTRDENTKDENAKNANGNKIERSVKEAKRGDAYETGGNVDKPFFDAGGMKLTSVEPKGKLIAQSSDNTCVAAALKMTLNDIGVVMSETKLAKALKTDAGGARVSDIPDALIDIGVNAKFEKVGSFESLEQAVNNGNSAVVSATIPGRGTHAVVVDSISNGQVSIRDPYPVGKGSSYTVSVSDFIKYYNRRGVVIKKP